MDRRRFLLTSLAGALAAPLDTAAQPPAKTFRIGILSNVPLTDPRGAPLWGAFTEGLRELGYVEGQNTTIVHRTTEGKYERLPSLAAELVRLKVDVIVVPAPQNAVVARQATPTIPIVMASAGDPLDSGLVESLARPGGNVTGTTGLVGPEIGGKRLELLKEAVPKVSRVVLLWNPANQSSASYVGGTKSAARVLAVQLQELEARGPEELERVFAGLTRKRFDAVLLIPDGMFLLHRARIAALAAMQRLPTMFGHRDHVDAGGLMCYGASMREGFRRAATYVDKILKGAAPGDLPIERPSKFELVINLKTAKALGLTIPPSLLARADQVID